VADKTYTPKIYKRNGGDAEVCASGAIKAVDIGVGGTANQIRVRTTTANVNSGATLLAALPGFAYRIHDISMIAIGGNAATATTVDVLGTQSSASVKLFAGAIANLTQSAVLRAGATGGTVLADGASFAACDANTAITIGKTGSSLATATAIDVLLTYSIEAQ
jgi:hypothetical protein